MMNITLLAAQAALADTLAGGNPVLTPVSEEARMNLWDMAMKGGWIMLVLALLSSKSGCSPEPMCLPSLCIWHHRQHGEH